MRKKIIFLQFAMAIFVLMACGSKNANAGNSSSPKDDQKSTALQEMPAQTAATIDGISQFVAWDMGVMKVSKEGGNFVLSDKGENLKLYLKPMGEGVYQEVSNKHDMIGQSARFVAEKVGDVTTLTAYNDKMILFTLFDCDDLMAYRNQAYHRLLKSRFEPTADGALFITDDEMEVPILPDSPVLSYFFIEDGEGDLTENIRLSPMRVYLTFSPADKGVNLHAAKFDPETEKFIPEYERENTIILKYAKDPGWEWLSTDVLDAGFLIFNFDKPYWKVMLNKLKKIKQPNAVERWNRKLIENLIKYNEPFTGLGSSDYLDE